VYAERPRTIKAKKLVVARTIVLTRGRDTDIAVADEGEKRRELRR